MVEELRGGAVSDGRSVVRLSPGRAWKHSLLSFVGLGLAVTVAGCTLPQSSAPTAPAATTYDFQGTDFRTSMNTAGADYADAVGFGDTAHVNNLIAGCYQQYDQAAQYQNELGATNLRGQLRRCLVIDYMAHKDNQAITSRGLAGNPYLSMDAFDNRAGSYGLRAGFPTPDQLFAFMRKGYAFAKPVEVAALRNGRNFQMPTLHKASGAFGF